MAILILAPAEWIDSLRVLLARSRNAINALFGNAVAVILLAEKSNESPILGCGTFRKLRGSTIRLGIGAKPEALTAGLRRYC